MPSNGGKALQGYKVWYLDQPKLIRVAVLPAIVAMVGGGLQIFPISDSVKIVGGLIFLLLLAWAAYNQLIEADELDDSRELAASFEYDSVFWQDKYRSASRLNRLFSELVQHKSEMWLAAMKELEDHGIEKARAFVRKKNALPENVTRIVAVIHKAFMEYVDTSMHEEIRVAYLGPSEDASRLELKSWCNSATQTPKGLSKSPESFAKGGNTLAVFVWQKSEEPIYFIDDVEAYCNKHQDDSGVFSYLNNGQRSTIRSIFCYRITDGLSGQCLGVLSIDSNVKGVFDGRISESICRDIVSSAAARIIFETRFSLMKNALGPYDDGDTRHVGQ